MLVPKYVLGLVEFVQLLCHLVNIGRDEALWTVMSWIYSSGQVRWKSVWKCFSWVRGLKGHWLCCSMGKHGNLAAAAVWAAIWPAVPPLAPRLGSTYGMVCTKISKKYVLYIYIYKYLIFIYIYTYKTCIIYIYIHIIFIYVRVYYIYI